MQFIVHSLDETIGGPRWPGMMDGCAIDQDAQGMSFGFSTVSRRSSASSSGMVSKVSRVSTDGGVFQFSGIGPMSCTISRCCDHRSFIFSGVPIPAPPGSLAGLNLFSRSRTTELVVLSLSSPRILDNIVNLVRRSPALE
jgi:hypothetical protein